MAEWIEIAKSRAKSGQRLSPLAMAEWIEIRPRRYYLTSFTVSASDGGVD